MAGCAYCGESIINKNDGGRKKTFCDKAHEKLWHAENKGNGFTTYDNDTPDVVEDRKARMIEYHKYHPLACAGDKEARRWLRHNLRLRAIWDNKNMKEVRL